MQRHLSTSRRARRAGILVLGISVLTACGLQRTGVQGTVTATVGQGQAVTTQDGGTTGGDGSTGTTGDTSTTGGTTGDTSTTGSTGDTGTTGSTGDSSTSGTSTTGTSGTSTGTSTSGGKASPTKGSKSSPSKGGLKGGSASSAPASTAATTKLNGSLTVYLTHVGGFSELSAGIPGISIPAEGTQAEATALATWVNAHGGIAGKALKTTYYDYNAQQASAQNETSYCKTIQGAGAFAAVIGGQIQPATRGCYASAKILAFEGSTYGMPQSVFDSYSPYYWAMSYPTYEEEEKAKISSLCTRKWFNGGSAVNATTKVGIAYWDDPAYTKVFNDVTTPALKACGFLAANIVGAAVADGDIQSIETGLNTAAAKFSGQQAKHVMFIGSAPLQPFFVQQANGQGFIYGVSSFDEPLYEEYNAASQMAGSMGVGFTINEDTDDAYVPFPQPGIETTCRDLYKSEGITLTVRYDKNNNAKEAMQWCQTVLWLKKVGDEVGPSLTTKSWSARAESDGVPFQGVFSWGSKEGAGDHSWASAYRDWAWDSSCSCGKYTSGVNSFG